VGTRKGKKGEFIMNRCVLLTSFCLFWLLLLFWQAPLCPQEKSGKDRPNPIKGDWTVVIRDRGSGGISCLVPDLRLSKFFGREPTTFRWKINKATIEMGKDVDGVFPQKRYSYKLHPGNQANAIDLILDAVDLDIENKADRRTLDAKAKKVQQGIYFVNDDYLMICVGRNSRPKVITNDEKDNPATIEVLRRGRLYKR
jgi:hypothetical protein